MKKVGGAVILFLLGALALTSGCEHGEVPEHPGRVDIVVIDDRAAPVANVDGRVETVNQSGGTYSIGGRTGADGHLLISGISAGRRLVEVVPPAEYVATDNDNRREVGVVEGETLTVAFRLRRRASGLLDGLNTGQTRWSSQSLGSPAFSGVWWPRVTHARASHDEWRATGHQGASEWARQEGLATGTGAAWNR